MIRPGSESPAVAALVVVLLGLFGPAVGSETRDNPARGIQSPRVKGGRQIDTPTVGDEPFRPVLDGASAVIVRAGIRPAALGATGSLRFNPDPGSAVPSGETPPEVRSMLDRDGPTPGVLASLFAPVSDPASVILVMSGLTGLYFRGRLHRRLRTG